MAGFGGSVKLTGEAAYRQALQSIAADLKNVAAQQKLTAASYDKTDTSLTALSKKSEDLKNKLSAQQKQYDTLSKALKDYTSQQEKAQSTIQKVQAQLDKEKAKLEQIAATYGKQSQEYKNQARVVDELEQQLKELNAQYEKNETTIKKTQAALTSSEADIKKTKAQMQDLGEKAQKAGQDAGKLGLAVEDSGKQAKNAADGGYTVLKNVLANLATQVIVKAIEGAKRLGTALVDVGKQSLAAYAEYEQLVGGVETLFKGSAKEVQQYAAVAYKTAGMSANQYMSTVTSFSASLLQGLGGDTKKAAKIADMAIIDMSDNANKMGTSIEMIQNAYQGFAKQNFTMLDNLKLGYGGTQAEMARLINETGVMGKAFKATAQNVKEVPFDKMIEAIHKVQENMGITGTTALEASETIEGSVNSMKASWSNLLTAIADDNADLGKSVNEFVDSTTTAAKNVIPRVRQIIDGIKKLIGSLTTEVFPKLKREIPELNAIIVPFEWLLNNYKTVVAGIQAIVAAFAVKKVLDFTKTISDAAKGLMTMAGLSKTAADATKGLAAAQGTATTATGLGTAAVKLFNAAWAANPLGVVVGGLALLAGGIIAVTNALGDNDSAAERSAKKMAELQSKVDNAKQSWNELQKAQQEQIDNGMTEMSYYEGLAQELKTITDENGKVKQGYEARASFITSTLSKALGIEISLQDGVIKKYKDLQGTIEETIKKKQAQLILDAQMPAYNEAIMKRQEAYTTLMQTNQQLTEAEANLKHAQEESTKALQSGNIFWQWAAQNELETAQARYNGLVQTYKDQDNLLKEYTYNVATYEDNMAKFHEGKYDEMSTATWNYVQQFQSAGDAQKAELEATKTTLEYALDYNKKKYEQTGDQIYKTEADRLQKQLDQTKTKLAEVNSVTDNELKNNGKSWLENSATVLSKLTDSKVEWKKTAEGQVQMYVDGVKQGEPMAETEAENITKAVLGEFDKKAEAEGAGKDVITGFTNGTGNFSLQNTAFRIARNFGAAILQKIKDALGIGSPSRYTKQYGKWLLQGLGIGMEKEEDAIIDQAEEFGENVLDALNGALEEGVSTKALQAIQNAIPSEFDASIGVNTSRMAEAQQAANNSLVAQFKQALSEMKIEMDDITMGQFVDNTVTKLVYN